MHSLATGTQACIGYFLSPLHWAGGQWSSEKQDSYFSLPGNSDRRWETEGQIYTKYRTHHHEQLAATGHTMGRQFASGSLSVIGS